MLTPTKFNYEEELAKCRTLEDITGASGLVQRLIKDAVETILNQEMDVYLQETKGTGNKRNGTSEKRIKTEYGDVEITVN